MDEFLAASGKRLIGEVTKEQIRKHEAGSASCWIVFWDEIAPSIHKSVRGFPRYLMIQPVSLEATGLERVRWPEP